MSKDALIFMLRYAKEHNLMHHPVEFVYNEIFNSQNEVCETESWEEVTV